MTGNGKHPNCGDDWGMVYYCYTHISMYIYFINDLSQTAEQLWRAVRSPLQCRFAAASPGHRDGCPVSCGEAAEGDTLKT